MKWLVEPEVFKGEAAPLLQALSDLKRDNVCNFGMDYEQCIKWVTDRNKGESLMFHGSFQFAEIIKRHNPSIKVFANLPKLECLYYYPRFGAHLLNANYIMLPFGDMSRRRSWINYNLCELFIRPNSGYKTFTGRVMNWDKDLAELRLRIDPETLVVLANAVKIAKEWRIVVVQNKAVTGCQYKENGNIVRVVGCPNNVMAYAQEVLNTVKYNPDPAWTLDICEVKDISEIAEGDLKVLEVGSFSCAGLYACDPKAVIQAIDSLEVHPQP